MIPLARGLDLPDDAVTQKFAILARSGAGKTYTGTKLCEEMLQLPAQVVVLDPVGVWYGLRLDADGKRAGAGLPVLGGAHGDVPLLPTTGAAVARLVVEHHLSVVLDVSEMRKGQRSTFVAAFAEELFHLKKTHRSPMHIFIEEAQTFVPQRTEHGEERMLGALEDICRLGRNYGIGTTLISQRPQSVNKEVLNQVECLIALQTNGPQERKAIEGWISAKGLDNTFTSMVEELPSLEIGQAFVWSPQWLKKFVRVKILKKHTFDASATPEAGASTSVQVPSIDIAQLRAALDTELKAAEANDPAVLRKKLAAAEKELTGLREAGERSPAGPPDFMERLDKIEAFVKDALREANEALISLRSLRANAQPPTTNELIALWSNKLRAGARAMLDVLVESYPTEISRAELAERANLVASSGTFSTYLGDLTGNGLAEKTRDGVKASPSLFMGG